MIFNRGENMTRSRRRTRIFLGDGIVSILLLGVGLSRSFPGKDVGYISGSSIDSMPATPPENNIGVVNPQVGSYGMQDCIMGVSDGMQGGIVGYHMVCKIWGLRYPKKVNDGVLVYGILKHKG